MGPSQMSPQGQNQSDIPILVQTWCPQSSKHCLFGSLLQIRSYSERSYSEVSLPLESQTLNVLFRDEVERVEGCDMPVIEIVKMMS